MTGVYCGLKARKLGLPETWANPMKLVADSANRGWDQPTKLFLWLLHMRWKNEKKAKTNEEQHNHKKKFKVLHECQDFLVLDKEGLKEEARKPLLSEALNCSNLAAMLIRSDSDTIPADNLLLPRPFPTVTLLPPNPDALSSFSISIVPCFPSFLFYELQLQRPPAGWVQTLVDSNICIAASTQLQCLPELIYIWGFGRTQRS